MPSRLTFATIPSRRCIICFFYIHCTNVKHQEPKLSAARRIVAEWTDYDEEMARLGEQIAEMK